MLAVFGLDAAEDGVDLVVEVIEDDSGALVGLEGLPRVDHEPRGRVLSSEVAHVDAGAKVSNWVPTRDRGGARGAMGRQGDSPVVCA